MQLKLKELRFNELVDYNVKVKQGKVTILPYEIDQDILLTVLKENRFFRLVKKITLTDENKGFFVTGKCTNFFKIKRLGNIITFAIENGKSYYIEVIN